MSEVKRSPPVLALHDGRAGNARQAEALARALAPRDWSAQVLAARAPWRWCAPRRLPGASQAFGPALAQALRVPPALAIGCGRQAALATRLLRERGASAVQILDPRLDPRRWDLVIVPGHDRLRGDNVLTLLGSLHPVDDAWLAAGRAAFPGLGALPAPRFGLLVGGPTARTPWTLAELQAACEPLIAQARAAGGSVLATGSRRTPADAVRWLRSRLRDVPGLMWAAPDEGDNPYAGLLGWADRIACTADSSNLLSEACATHAPVAVVCDARSDGKLRGLREALRARGRLAEAPALFEADPATPLRETARIAAEVARRLALPWPTTAAD